MLPTPLARKVPEIIALFWIVKLLTTAMGESTTDYLVFQINPYVAVVAGCIGLAIALGIQLLASQYVAWVYWLAVVMVAVFGTMMADVVHVVLGVPYWASTACLSVLLVVVFAAWHRTEKTLSIHSISRGRRELFYWAAVMATFALGTAAGDFAASTLRLGYFAAALLFLGLFALPGLGYWLFRLNGVVAFWFAYVITRPLGASVADWLGKPSLGGLGLGDGHVAVVLSALIVVLVAYLTLSNADRASGSAAPTAV